MLRHTDESSARLGTSEPPSLAVAIISEEFPPETWGGIGTYTFDMARALARLGHRVHVITRTWGEARRERVEDVVVHRIPLPEPSWRTGTWYLNLKFPELRYIVLWNLQVRRALRSIMERERIDLVECPEYHAQGLWASLTESRIPMVVRLHTPAFLCRRINGVAVGGSRLDAHLSENMEHRLTLRARLLTAPSRAMVNEVAAHWSLGSRAVRVIPNPLDESLFDDRDPIARDDRTILFAGRLERRKGVETAADAIPLVLKSVPGARFRFVGHDHPSAPGGRSMLAHLREMLEAASVPGDAVAFTDSLVRADLSRLYRSAAISIVPSFYESFGYTCVEAMAAGAAVVASNGGALSEIVTHEHDGLAFPVGNSALLADAIVRLLTQPALRRVLGEEARRTVRNRFGLAAVGTQTADSYRQIIRGAA